MVQVPFIDNVDMRAHEAVRAYCTRHGSDGTREAALEKLRTDLQDLPAASLITIQKSGEDNLLTVALRAPYDKNVPHMVDCPYEARIQRAYNASKALLEIAEQKLSLAEKIVLLTHPTKFGFTPLHTAINTGNEEVYKLVLGKLDALRFSMGETLYAEQFIAFTNERFSPLHSALCTGNAEVVESIISHLDQLYQAGVISQRKYVQQFTVESFDQFTPLHSVLHPTSDHASEKTALLFLDKLASLHQNSLISDDVFAEQLTLRDHRKGYSPLETCVIAGFNEVGLKLINQIETLQQKNIISDKIYIEQYTYIHGGHSLLHSAVRHSNIEIVKRIIDQLDQLYQSKKIDKQTYVNQFCDITDNGFSLLHTAVRTGNKAIFMLIRDRLHALKEQNLITLSDLKQQYTQAEHGVGITPLLNAVDQLSCKITKQFLNDLAELHKDRDGKVNQKEMQDILLNVDSRKKNILHWANNLPKDYNYTDRTHKIQIVKLVHDFIREHIGENFISTLYAQENDSRYLPRQLVPTHRGPWGRDIISRSSDESPLHPRIAPRNPSNSGPNL